MEKREYSFEEIKAYCTDYKKQHVSDDMQHQLYVCLVLGIKERYIEQLRDEKIVVEKRELLKEALLNDFPEEIYNRMLLSEDVTSCRQIREDYLTQKYAENNPALKRADEQVKEFHELLEKYKYRIESNEELAKAISTSQSAVGKAYEAQIKNLQDTSAAISEEKEKRLAEKDKIIDKLEKQNLQLEEKHKEEKAALCEDMEQRIVEKVQTIEKMETQRQQLEKEWQEKKEELEDIISNLQEEKLQLIKENHQGTPVFSPQAPAGTIGAAESTAQKSEETTEKKKGFFGRKKAEPIGKINHTPEERSAMVEFIRTNGFDATQNDFLIRCFKEKGVPFSRIQEIAAKHLTAEEMQELLNILTM